MTRRVARGGPGSCPARPCVDPPANHCEISMLANIRRIRRGCQPPKCNRMGTFHPSTELIPVCGITLGNFSKRVYNRAVDCRSLASKEVSMFDSLADRIKQD